MLNYEQTAFFAIDGGLANCLGTKTKTQRHGREMENTGKRLMLMDGKKWKFRGWVFSQKNKPQNPP